MSFLVVHKSPKVGKKVEKIGLGSFNLLISIITQNGEYYIYEFLTALFFRPYDISERIE